MTTFVSTFTRRLADMDGYGRRRALRSLCRRQADLAELPSVWLRAAYTLKALVVIAATPMRDETDGGLVLAVCDYQPDFEYTQLGSWEELAVGYGLTRGWWWAWGSNSSV